MILGNAGLSKEANKLIKDAEQFAQQHLAPNAALWGQGQFDRQALFESAGAAGLLGLQVPLEFGGSNLSFTDKVKVLYKLAQIDFSAAMAVAGSGMMVQVTRSKFATLGPAVKLSMPPPGRGT